MSELLELLKNGDTIYSVVEHVSQSRMKREINFFLIKDNEPYYINHAIADILGYELIGNNVIVRGCGIDMAWSVVDNLSDALGMKLKSQNI